ncbi:low temperature requirement protein A [Streptomyces sp. TLI_146]|uniref:low temperature requirement protein A n=1 Tax=Streptomyces sp. TLI_146 TaxID=1938858 RepID=UPI000C714028|nr:low temperature requirement protein A [Streptomyces sp. TLI_146]PKV89820.1 low temperature requirement protein LtrA [Streptomyces sp. TLI_146]
MSAVDGPARASESAVGRRVSTLELFFDLVFVFTITQLTVLLSHDLSFAQAGRVLLIFAVLFWMYGAYAYLTNQVPPETNARRIPLILGMCGFLTCALAIPRVFTTDGVAFGLGYLLVTVVHGALYALLHGRHVLSFALTNVLAALCVTAAGTVSGRAAETLWLAALVLQAITPVLSSRITTDVDGDRVPVTGRVGELDPAHFVERHGLLLIVAFGESVIAIGVGSGDLRLDWGLFGGVVLALALTTALWWTYFIRDEEAAEQALRAVSGLARFRVTMLAYYYSFVPMLLGVAVLAAGVKKSVGHLPDHLPTAPAIALAGGVALFLAGNVAFRAVLHIPPLRFRAAGAAAVLATIPLGTRLSSLAELFALVLVLIAMLLAEALWAPCVHDDRASAV